MQILMQSVFFMNRYVYTRWMDSGAMEGFVHQHRAMFDGQQPAGKQPFHWQVMTRDDLHQRADIYDQTLAQKRMTKSGKYVTNNFNIYI